MQRAGSIEDGQVIAGNGSIDRMNWVAESDRPRGYTVNFPITHLGWRAAGGSVHAGPKRHGHAHLDGSVRGGFERGGLPAGSLVGRPAGRRDGAWPTAVSSGAGRAGRRLAERGRGRDQTVTPTSRPWKERITPGPGITRRSSPRSTSPVAGRSRSGSTPERSESTACAT